MSACYAELMVIEALDGRHPRLLIEQGRSGEFVRRMSDALVTFAAGFAPRPVTYRPIDFRTTEFAARTAENSSSQRSQTR